MALDRIINKVIDKNSTLLDLTNDTVNENRLLEDITAHNSEGEPITGRYDASDAEAWARGTRYGIPVSNTDETYHNNALFYAEESENYAAISGSCMNIAGNYAETAENQAIRSGSFANIAGLSAESAEQSEIRSGSFANIAGLSAETANDNALKSEGFAVGKQNGTDVGSTSPYYHNNAEYFKDLAEEAARQAGGVDMTGATATTDGTHGLIKQPAAGDQNKVFYGDGTWKYAGDVRRNELVDTVGWTGKNLIPYPYTNSTTTTRGVTYTVNGEGDISLSGTCNSTNSAHFYVTQFAYIKAGSYVLTGNNQNTSSLSGTGLRAYKGTSIVSANILGIDTGNGIQFTLNTDSPLLIIISITYNVNATGFTFSPMLRHADIIDDTYEPYHESVEAELQELHDAQRLLGAKNLLSRVRQSSISDLTVTENSDGSITVSGTPTSKNRFKVWADNVQPYTNYIATGIKDAVNMQYFSYELWENNNRVRENGIYNNSDPLIISGKAVNFNRIALVYENTENNVACSGTIYPMLRYASDTDDTYAPFANSNRDLTLNKTERTDLAPVESGATASQAYTTGQYIERPDGLYKVIADIASGGSFTVNTNIKKVNVGDEIYSEITKCIDYEMTTPSLSAGSVNITLYNPAITAEMKARPYADYSISGAYADLTVNTYDGSVTLTGTVSAATTITFWLYTPTVISNIPQ